MLVVSLVDSTRELQQQHDRQRERENRERTAAAETSMRAAVCHCQRQQSSLQQQQQQHKHEIEKRGKHEQMQSLAAAAADGCAQRDCHQQRCSADAATADRHRDTVILSIQLICWQLQLMQHTEQQTPSLGCSCKNKRVVAVADGRTEQNKNRVSDLQQACEQSADTT